MAIINIPMGGQSIPIDVPDFAMESTQADILAAANQQVAALNRIAGIESQAAQNENRNQQNQVRQQTKSDQIVKSSGKTMQEGFNSLQKAVNDQQSLSDLVNSAQATASSVFDSIPGVGGFLSGVTAGLGGATGFVISALEKFGVALSYTQRVGIGLTTSLADVREASATMGVTLDDFGRLMIQNGAAVRSLGTNMETGYQRVAQLSDEFRRITLNVGHFGMSAGEMNEMLLEEIEMRRVTLGQQAVANASLEEMAQSARDNRIQQMALARLTGQDVRERMAAQQSLQSNVLAQEYLTNASEDTRRKLLDMGSALSSVPGGEQIQNAIVASLATGIDAQAFAPELFAYLGPQARNLLEFVQSNLEGDMGSGEFAAEVQRYSSALADGGSQMGSTLSVLSAFGDESATQVLAIRNQTVRLAETNDEFMREYGEALDVMVNTTNLAAAGINNQFSTLMARFNARIMDFSAELFGGLDEHGAGTGLLQTLQAFNDVLNSDSVREAARGAGETTHDLIVGAINEVIPDIISRTVGEMFSEFTDGTLNVRVDNINEFPLPNRN